MAGAVIKQSDRQKHICYNSIGVACLSPDVNFVNTLADLISSHAYVVVLISGNKENQIIDSAKSP